MAPLPRLGKFLLALGVIGLIRLIPEVLQISKVFHIHAMFFTIDAVLALMTAAAGEGLRHGKGWAPKLAMRAAGVMLSTSVGMMVFIVHWLTEHRFRMFDPHVVSRMLYYVLAVAFWPYAVRTVIVAAPEASRAALKASFIIWLILGIPAASILLVVFR